MAKFPSAGQVKTRLRPFLSADQSASLAACFLEDTIAKVRQITRNIVVAYSPADAGEQLKTLLPDGGDGLLMVAQKGNDLGERLESALLYAESEEFSPVIIIGADSPTLLTEFIKTAIESFKSNQTDIALGATRDGGFYLVGLRRNHAGLFENVAWSSDLVFGQTKRNAERLGLRLSKLESWYDVDTPDDLFYLRNEMLADENGRQSAPKTYEWLARNARLFMRWV
ncbi:MAG TPA: TIGR04282 family arsenosugar biosynthesis glycosyltransferase [Pyrinomonadaceae bacterium]|nr:TIGR04282 family arsenosugar biosynthesis glycosyltransferase [Pyrinomonadaceae bacterium]